ncbi:MAG: hypothetical protein AB7O62_05145 [Pirellulales bacterium]
MLIVVRGGLLSCLALLFAAGPAWAQVKLPPNAQAELAKFPPTDVSGTVVGVEPGQVMIKSTSGSDYVIGAFDNFGTIEVTGKAKFEFLRPGVFITFTVAELDKKGNATGDITGLTVYTPEEGLEPSVESDDLEGVSGPWLIRGQIKAINKTGKATVFAGKGSVKVQFPEDAEIEIACRDYSLAQEGDSVTVNGHEVSGPAENKPGKIVAVKLEIQLAEPAGLPAKKGKRPSKPSRKSKEKPDAPKDPFNQGDE